MQNGTLMANSHGQFATDKIADALVNVTLLPYQFLIVGHIDATGRREDNAVLSQRRADAVKSYLISKGANGTTLTASTARKIAAPGNVTAHQASST